MPKTIKIVIADDHPVVFDGVKLLFSQLSDYEIVGVAISEKEIISVCTQMHPDVLILDLNLGGKNSLDSVPELKSRFEYMKILIFSSYQTPILVKKAIEMGIDGYLLKDATLIDWSDALGAIAEGNIYLSKSIRKNHKDTAFETDSFSQLATLSEQEKRVMNLIVNGMIEKQIAETLHISKHTVHSHKKNILKKLNLHTNADLVRFVYENNLV
ncbi:response regulator transcription factor [Emticicia sp. BO119]|uniref:LuxR C-terminal-related transcriptional regulator n=1 Tax=Emticicia sp. BO119 TaxID=2757768 RepID=UPI0015F0B2E3|nr:response regulator transcription factor [Emticicia sp. BO119]MBA4849625.1 response regulator transcription factor [Emticicia sp. BO119]